MTRKEYNDTVKKVSGRLYTYLKKMIRDNAMADDFVQEAFARLWEKRKELKVEQAEKWLFTTGYHLMLNWIKREKRNEFHDDMEFNLEADDGNYDVKEWLNKGLERLDSEQRNIILLRDMQGYSYKEIEEITGQSESQVKVYLFRARKQLKIILEQLDKTTYEA